MPMRLHTAWSDVSASVFSVVLAVVSALLLAGCGSVPRTPDRLAHDRFVHGDQRPIPKKPATRDPSLANEIIEMSFGYQMKQMLDAPRLVRKLAGRPYQALNVDRFDEVPNSTWFTNRNSFEPMSLAAITKGPNETGPPAPTGIWKVVALKSAGVTPGMTIVDARGERYLIKFDPPDFAELSSGAEAVASKLFHAAGYNVPENYVVDLEVDRLSIDASAMFTVETNDARHPVQKRRMTEADLRQILSGVVPAGQRRVRVLASRFLSGVPVGPWRYTGVRRGDPNDVYPHEHRREVRGLYIVASWLNHADMKEENTLDTYDPERRFLTHYLIDFGASMGSNSIHPSNPRRGQANSFDLKDSLTRLATLGLFVHGYEKAPRTVRYPSVGYLENDLFRPDKWKPMYPAPAFENLTRRDAFWGAKIVTAFSHEQIEAAVEAGGFSDPAAAAYLVRFLVERRDAIGAYWFARTNTLDRFTADGLDALDFADLAVERGYAAADSSRYRFAVLDGQGRRLDEGIEERPRLLLAPQWRQEPYIVVSLLPQRPEYQARPVWVYLRPVDRGWEVVGLDRRD
jgi:hypothetical protein